MTGIFSEDPLEEIVKIGKMQLGYIFWRVYRKHFHWTRYVRPGTGFVWQYEQEYVSSFGICDECLERYGRGNYCGQVYTGSPIIMW